LLEKGIEAVRSLPADRQDLAGELLLSLAASAPQYLIHGGATGRREAGDGRGDPSEYASDEDMADIWKKFGR
jgi:hypothetical protein